MLSLTTRKSCCAAGPKGSGPLGSFMGSLLPAGLLLLIPKCPLCIVAYVAAFTGLGMSVSAASNLRMVVIFISIAALVYLAASIVLSLGRRSKEL